MKLSPDSLIFRGAREQDIEDIVGIHNANVIGEQAQFEKLGFLLERIDCDLVLKRISSTTDRYYVTTDKSDSVLGYLALSNEIDRDVLLRVEWGKTFSPGTIQRERHLHIAVAAVKPDVVGRGVGRFSYDELYSLFPDYIFSAFVAAKPYSNQRSLDFHIKQGFHIAGHYRADRFCGLNNYESRLLVKTT